MEANEQSPRDDVPAADVSEQHADPDGSETAGEPPRSLDGERHAQASDADLIESETPVGDEGPGLPSRLDRRDEGSEADVLDQKRVEPLDEEAER